MIHNPEPWLALLKQTSSNLGKAKAISTSADFVTYVAFIEFYVHQSLFAVRKIDESIGIDLALEQQQTAISEWPSNLVALAEIRRTTDPDLSRWYDLRSGHQRSESYKRIVNVFIHAQVLVFTVEKLADEAVRDLGVFLGSDHTMHKGILHVTLESLKGILDHAIGVFEPRVLARREKARQA